MEANIWPFICAVVSIAAGAVTLVVCSLSTKKFKSNVPALVTYLSMTSIVVLTIAVWIVGLLSLEQVLLMYPRIINTVATAGTVVVWSFVGLFAIVSIYAGAHDEVNTSQ